MSNGIEHLNEGVDGSSLHDLDDHITRIQGAPTPHEFIDQAQQFLSQQGGTQFDPLTMIALASLLFSLYTYFKDHHAARFMVKRAAANPHGFAAMLVHKKVEDRLPSQLKGIPNVAAGVTQLTDAALDKVGV